MVKAKDNQAELLLYIKGILLYKSWYFTFFNVDFQSLFRNRGFNTVNIETLIPHRNGMKLVDSIVKVDEHIAVTESTVTSSWPLVKNNAVNSLVLIELVAQTSAVCIGWKELQDTHENMGGKGWLVGIKSASFFTGDIPLNTQIMTQTCINFTMDNYTEIQGESKAGDVVLGKIILQVLKNIN
jgi:predicted hotdog family 3-hydroxylacyl-ACP dehydratase